MKVYVDGLYPLLQIVIEKLLFNHDITINNLLVNTYDRPDCESTKQWMTNKKIHWVVEDYHKNFQEVVKKFRPDVIISAYGLRIIPKTVLQITSKQFNMHPSFLPDYKGRMIIPWVILNGETSHGITYHAMTENIDVGDILYQTKFTIPEKITAIELYALTVKQFELTFDMFFKQLCEGKIQPTKMLPGGRYFQKDLPYDGKIDPNWNNEYAERFIRAMNFPPHKQALFNYNNNWVECNNFDHFLSMKNNQNILHSSK